MARGMGNRSGTGNGGRVAGSTTNTLPGYVKGAYNNLIKRTVEESKRPYKPYPKSPLADEDPMVGQASSMLRDFVGSNWDAGYDQASGIYGGIDARAKQLANFQGRGVSYNGPANFQAHNYTTQSVNPWDISSQDVSANQWDAEQAQKYMSPYLNNVLDVQKSRAGLDFRREQISRNDAAAAAGAFGGSRHGVVDALGQEAHLRNMAEIDATGMNNAWAQALQAFGGDRDAALQAAMSNQSSALDAAKSNQAARLQGSLANQNANLEAQRLADLSRQYGYTQQMTQADRDLEAQKLSEEFRQSGADIALRGLDARNTAAGGIASLTSNRARENLAMTDALNKYGLQATARDQALKDFQMQKFMDRRNHNKNNLNWMSGILQGVPVTSTDQTQSTYVNPYSQFLGLATAGLGAYQTFFGNNGGGGGSLY